MNTSLDSEVLALLNARRGEWKSIAEQSKVSYSWLSKFANGHIANPGYGTLRDLYWCLSANASTAANERESA